MQAQEAESKLDLGAPAAEAGPVRVPPEAPPAPAASLWSVVERELIRTSRRWQTVALRAAFAAGLLAAIVLFWATHVAGGGTEERVLLAQSGRAIFGFYKWTQFLILAALTPIVVAQSIIDEREGRTIELLAITRLSPVRLLWGKLLSRVVLLELLILAGMPVMTICASLGGVELGQFANVWLQTTTLILSAGAVAAFLGLFAQGPITPAITTWIWMAGAWTMGALPHGVVAGATDKQTWAMTSPLFGLGMPATGWRIAGSLLTWTPVALLTMWLAAAGFRAMVAGADDPSGGFGTLSRDFMGLRRAKVGSALLFVGLLVATPVVVFQRLILPSFPPVAILSWAWNVGWLVLGTFAWLLAARASYLRLAARRARRHRPGWKKIVKAWSAVEPDAAEILAAGRSEADAWADAVDGQARRRATVPGATGRDLSGKAASATITTRRPRFSPLREVWGNPVAWREVVTRAHGGLSRQVLRSYVVLGLMVGSLFAVGAFKTGPAPAIAAAIAGFFMAALVVLLTATASVAGEIRARTLELICASRMSGAEILLGKLAATGLLAGPAWLAASLMMLLAVGLAADTSEELQAQAILGWLLRSCGLAAWTAAALVAAANLCHWIGLRARSASHVWLWTITAATAWAIGPPIALGLARGSDVAAFLAGLANPLASEQFWGEGKDLPIQLFVAVGVWAGVALVLFADNARRIGRRAGRG